MWKTGFGQNSAELGHPWISPRLTTVYPRRETTGRLVFPTRRQSATLHFYSFSMYSGNNLLPYPSVQQHRQIPDDPHCDSRSVLIKSSNVQDLPLKQVPFRSRSLPAFTLTSLNIEEKPLQSDRMKFSPSFPFTLSI